MACHGNFPFSHAEKDPNPKSGWDVDPDKLGRTVGEIKPTQIFCMLFSGFLSTGARYPYAQKIILR